MDPEPSLPLAEPSPVLTAPDIGLLALGAGVLFVAWVAASLGGFAGAALAADSNRHEAQLPSWMRAPNRLAAALTVAQIGLWTLVAGLAIRLAQGLEVKNVTLLWAVPAGVALMSLLVISSGRSGRRHPIRALTVGGFWLRMLGPLLYLPARALSPLYRRLTEAPTADQRAAELAGLAQTIDETPEIDSPVEEKALLKSLITLNQKPVRAVMCPREQMRTLRSSDSFSSVLRQIREYGFSRYPVMDPSGATVRGILVAKDLLPLIDDPNADWRRLLRAPYLAAETKRVPQLLSEFKLRRIHLAVVISEQGQVSGLVTLQDILEEIFGELKDEFDAPAPPQVRTIEAQL